MARFSPISVYMKMKETGLIPVFYHPDFEISRQVVKACYDGGVKVFEFTNRGDFAHEVFNELIKWAEKECPEMILGAGSIVDAPTASLYIQTGANFIVGPLLNPEIFRVCNRRLIPYCPGCATATEIGNAQELGAVIVKVFPGSNAGGPSFIKNIKGPMPWSLLMVTGGVEPTEENLLKWFMAGVTCVGMGSNLFPDNVIADRKWESISEMCSNCLHIIKSIRKQA